MTIQSELQPLAGAVTDAGFYTQVCLSADGLVVHLMPDGSVLKIPVSRYKGLLAMAQPRPSRLPHVVAKLSRVLAWCLRLVLLLASSHDSAT